MIEKIQIDVRKNVRKNAQNDEIIINTIYKHDFL